MEIKKEIFREYDIRGIYGEDLTEEIAYQIGRAYASYSKEETVVIGHDNRSSSPSLTKALIKGLIDSGAFVYELGMVTTPMFYFAKKYFQIPTGIMVTASHNPGKYNGLKLSFSELGNACGKEITDFYEFLVRGEFVEKHGWVEEKEIKEPYIEAILESIHLGKHRPKIVVDLGNGVASVVVREVLTRLGLEYTIMNEKKDLSVVTNYLDPSKKSLMEPLGKKVIKLHYDLGIGLDGDADRVGVVDEKGNHVSTENYMIIMSRDLKKKIPLQKVLFDVKCSKGLIEELKRQNITPMMYRTGNSYVARKMIEDDFLFGGEFSGHLFFRDKWYGFDDGLYNGLRMVELLSWKEEPLSSLYQDTPTYYQTEELLFPVLESLKFPIINALMEEAKKKNLDMITIDGMRVSMEDYWFSLRASNTTPNLSLRIEAKSKERLEEVTKELETYLRNYIDNFQMNSNILFHE